MHDNHKHDQTADNVPICQSCGLPMKKESDFGTKKDGAPQDEYCRYCYQGGNFTDPDATLEDKINKNIQMAMGKIGMPEKEARKLANDTLPKLKRWQGQESPQRQKTRIIFALITGLIFLIVLVTYIFTRSSTEKSSSSGTSPAAFIPIWVAVFIPLLASKKKGKPKTTPQQKRLLTMLVILTVLVVIGTIVLVLLNK